MCLIPEPQAWPGGLPDQLCLRPVVSHPTGSPHCMQVVPVVHVVFPTGWTDRQRSAQQKVLSRVGRELGVNSRKQQLTL